MLKAGVQQWGSGCPDATISQALDISVATIERGRQGFVEQGLASALGRKSQPRPQSRRLDGEQEAHLIALACSESPAEPGRWSLRLLAERMVALEYVKTVSHETVRQTFKK